MQQSLNDKEPASLDTAHSLPLWHNNPDYRYRASSVQGVDSHVTRLRGWIRDVVSARVYQAARSRYMSPLPIIFF